MIPEFLLSTSRILIRSRGVSRIANRDPSLLFAPCIPRLNATRLLGLHLDAIPTLLSRFRRHYGHADRSRRPVNVNQTRHVRDLKINPTEITTADFAACRYAGIYVDDRVLIERGD
jgi:hypothetical protein